MCMLFYVTSFSKIRISLQSNFALLHDKKLHCLSEINLNYTTP